MSGKTESVYWELVRFYRIDGGPVESEALGLYCSKERANMERAIYMDTGCLLYTSPSPRDRG